MIDRRFLCLSRLTFDLLELKETKHSCKFFDLVEYKSLAFSVAETIWLQTVLHEFGIYLSQAPTLWCDNIAANYLSVNWIFHSKTKHMDIDFHIIWDRVAAKSLQVSFCNSHDQITYVLKKSLVANRFYCLQ